MIALIDADIVCHRIGFTTENDEWWIAKYRCNEMLDGILRDTDATEYQLWLSDTLENNFRSALYPFYKANRTLKAKPKHHEALKEYLITEWGARFAYGMEADDALGIEQFETACGNPFKGLDFSHTIICSIDKDLKQIPGLHYNFVKKEFDEVSTTDGLISFYTSILVGDTTDNIDGCRGIGPAKSAKLLAGATTPEECINRVVATYEKQHKDWSRHKLLEHILLAGRLLKIKQSEDEPLWDFPLSALTEELQQLSIQHQQVVSDLSTELTSQEAPK